MLTNLLLVEKSEQGTEQFRKGVEQAETQAKTMANNSIEGEIKLSKTILRNDLDWIDNEIKTKRRQLEKHDREERLRTVKLKLESLTSGFEKKGRKALEKVLKEYQGFMEEYQDVMDEEKTLGSGLKNLILRARLAEADARDRFIAGDNQMKAQEEGRKITLLMQTYLLAGGDTGSDQVEKNINKGIKDLIKLDNDYGNALSAVFNKLQERSDKNKQNENG
jgi:hypothetical protein